jgi:MYXO-CTERM domain-containing protein
MMRLGQCAVGLALALVGAACGSTYSMTDDIDLTWDFGLTPRRFEDNLHSPYVRGAAVTVFAHSSDDKEDLQGWSIESSDPAVFRIDGPVASGGRDLAMRGEAVGEGTAALTLRDPRGHAVGHGVAEVRLPDAIELDAHGSLILGRDDEARVTEARVLAGGAATYLVRYFQAGRELHGNGVLSADVPAGVTAEPRTTFLFEDREWLTLRTTAAATGTVQLLADGVAAATVPVAVVPESAVADVVVLTEPEHGHKDGDWLAALAQAYDPSGARIFGVDYQWNVNGAAQQGDGDLYRYQFKAGQPTMVQAQRGTHADSAQIQSQGGYVGSTNHVGCAAGGGGSLIVGLVGLGLVAGRRRRVTRRG